MYYRDCYGFRKASQWVTLEDHHAHEESYQGVLERRLSKWEQLLKEHESRLPERCSKGMKKDHQSQQQSLLMQIS